MKKQVMHAIRQYGDGLKHLESQSIKSGTELLQKFQSYGTNAFDPYSLIRTCLTTIIMSLAYGKCSPPDVEAIHQEEDKLGALFEPAGAYLLLDIIPSLRFIVPSMKRAYKDLLDVADKIHGICNKLTNSRREILHLDNPQRKFYIDHFLSLKNKQIMDHKAHTKLTIDDDNIYLMGTELLLAGISTTSYVLYALLGILVNHPQIQDRAFEEITSVLGDRPPTIDDKKHMPYMEAVILETLRYTGFTALLVPHYTKKGGELGGYFIPENTVIFVNIWNLQHDERYWDRPWVFDPLRFIENDDIVPADHKNRQRVLVFSAGRRHCPGEIFAKNRLFILVTIMLQKYRFLAAEGFPKPKHDPRDYDYVLNLKIKPYHVCVQSRK